jgi:hypothetical protein
MAAFVIENWTLELEKDINMIPGTIGSHISAPELVQ